MKWPSQKVRDTFIQYFVKHRKFPHTLVPSSSIVPRNDPSLAFVNAGMNQFKDVILGYGRPAHPRVTNSQKCLRINDLHLVGADTYHHTFFEMLGNWSFSNYFKKDACELAWALLTSKYKLDPDRLFVTYYAGSQNVPPDKETRQIWESMGVKPDRILPFTTENFWKMGPMGPCGPSTEIHYDHRGANLPPSDEINGDSGQVVEIWNLVFMQYNMNSDGQLERLPLSHVVDTGAGLERLCAVLNGKVSNYDTDLFTPLFDGVKGACGGEPYGGDFSTRGERDTCYRIFADHMRAITVALADGVLPQTNQKIRKLIQRTLAISDQQFSISSLSTSDRLKFLIEAGVTPVTKTLSNTFPEISKMNGEISKILESEVERYTDLALKSDKAKLHSDLPPILLMNFPALSRISKADLNMVKDKSHVDGKTAYRWYDSCGVTSEAIEELCSTLGLQFDSAGMDAEMKQMKKMFRDEVAAEMIANEDRVFVRKLESLMGLYDPKDSGGVCNPTMNLAREANPGVFIEWIFDGNGDPVEEICSTNDSHWIILNKTPFVPGSEDFETDKGTLTLENGTILKVEQVRRLPSGWILHLVKNVPELGLSRKAGVKEFDLRNDVRFGREMSAKAVGHIQWWLKEKFGVVRFDDEKAMDKWCSMTVTILDGDLSVDIIHQLQNDLNEFGVPVVLTQKSNPGKKAGVSEVVFATSLTAEQSMRYGQEVLDCLSEISELCKETGGDRGKEVLRIMVDRVAECVKREDLMLPLEVYQEADKVLQVAEKILWKSEEAVEIARMCRDIEADESRFIVKLFESDHEFSSLKKVTRVAENQNKPVLVLIKSSEDFVYGRCAIPKNLISSGLSAEEWMKCVCKELGKGIVAAPKGQDNRLQVNLKRTRIYDGGERIGAAMGEATRFVAEKLGKKFIECGGSEFARIK